MKNIFKILISSILIVCIFLAIVYFNVNAKEDKILENKIIYIDAGHGGKDNGASVDGVMEDSINLAISGFLIEKLVNEGAYVLMSRTSDYDLSSMYQANKKREDLKKRVKYINDSKPDIFLSIHLNTYPQSYVKGGQVFYKNDVSSKVLAESIQQQMNTLSNENKKIKIGDYFILNNTIPIGVLVECGFLSNNEERSLLNTENYQKQIAESIKDGIISYFNYKSIKR